jgi:hypothetical protein
MKRLASFAIAFLLMTSTLIFTASAEDFDVQVEVQAAMAAVETAHNGIGGMGGIGIIPEPDLSTIQGLLGEAERLVREARSRAQGTNLAPHEIAWIVGYARAGAAMALAADQYRKNQRY